MLTASPILPFTASEDSHILPTSPSMTFSSFPVTNSRFIAVFEKFSGPCPVLTTTKTPPQTTMPSFVPTTKPTLSPTTTTTEDPTEKREFMPFLTGKVLNCNVNGSMESYLSTLSVCCGGKVLRRSSGSKCCNGVQERIETSKNTSKL